MMIVTACTTVTSSVTPGVQEYTKEEQRTLETELNAKCPLSKDQFGNEVHSCPMIDRVISDYRKLRQLNRVARGGT